MTNENCLSGTKCPQCGSEGPFSIRAEANFLVTDDGTEEYSDVDWYDTSYCRCVECQYSACVENFQAKRR